MFSCLAACAVSVRCAFAQLSFKSAQAHKHHVQDIMLSAPTEQMVGNGPFRKPLLGVLYDEVCRSVPGCALGFCWICTCPCCGREFWADRSSKLGDAFSVDAQIERGKSIACLRRATALHDHLFKNLPGASEVQLAPR